MGRLCLDVHYTAPALGANGLSGAVLSGISPARPSDSYLVENRKFKLGKQKIQTWKTENSNLENRNMKTRIRNFEN